MNKIKREKNKDFTTISNVFLRDENLSLKAKGFLAVIMGLPDDWEFSIRGICAILKEGRDSVYSAINELKVSGYCRVEVLRDEETGKMAGSDYTFTEIPDREIPCPENPYPENPDMENPTQLNIYRINKEIEPIKEEYIAPIKPKLKKFVKPTIEEIRAYCQEKGIDIDPDYFWNFYESKDWMIGKNHMKNWKSCIATWNTRDRRSGGRNQKPVNDGRFVNDLWDNFEKK